MELQLKNVHFSERLSQETNAFTADIFYKGKKVGYAENDGHGGCTNINSYPEQREAFNEAVKYAKSLPTIKTDFTHGVGGKVYEIDSDIESRVDDLFTQWLEKKELTKNSNKGIIFSTPDGKQHLISWKGHTVSKLKKSAQGIAAIKQVVLRVQSEGNTVLNTNLKGIL